MESIVIVVADATAGQPTRRLADIAKSVDDVQAFADLVVRAAADVVAVHHGLMLPVANGVAAAGRDTSGRVTIEVPVDLPSDSFDALRVGLGPDESIEALVYERVRLMTGSDAAYDVEFRTA